MEDEYNRLPQHIKNIVDTFDEDKCSYAECARIKKELETVGYTCDYGLDGSLYDIKKQ